MRLQQPRNHSYAIIFPNSVRSDRWLDGSCMWSEGVTDRGIGRAHIVSCIMHTCISAPKKVVVQKFTTGWTCCKPRTARIPSPFASSSGRYFNNGMSSMLGTQTAISSLLKQPSEEGCIESLVHGWSLLMKESYYSGKGWLSPDFAEGDMQYAGRGRGMGRGEREGKEFEPWVQKAVVYSSCTKCFLINRLPTAVK